MQFAWAPHKQATGAPHVDVEHIPDVDVDVEDVAGTPASPDWRSSTRTGTFGRPPSIRRDKPLLRFSRSHNLESSAYPVSFAQQLL